MKPTELYQGDTLLRERDGRKTFVKEIYRMRPSKDTYKKPGAERYFITLSCKGYVASSSVWSDEDVPGVSWLPDHVSEEDYSVAYLKSLRREYNCDACGAAVSVDPGYNKLANMYYAETTDTCPECGKPHTLGGGGDSVSDEG